MLVNLQSPLCNPKVAAVLDSRTLSPPVQSKFRDLRALMSTGATETTLILHTTKTCIIPSEPAPDLTSSEIGPASDRTSKFLSILRHPVPVRVKQLLVYSPRSPVKRTPYPVPKAAAPVLRPPPKAVLKLKSWINLVSCTSTVLHVPLCIYTYIYTFTHICMCVPTCIPLYVYMYTCVYIHVCIYIYTYMYVCVCASTCVCMYMYAYI